LALRPVAEPGRPRGSGCSTETRAAAGRVAGQVNLAPCLEVGELRAEGAAARPARGPLGASAAGGGGGRRGAGARRVQATASELPPCLCAPKGWSWPRWPRRLQNAPGPWPSSEPTPGRAQQRGKRAGLTYRWTRAREASAWPALFGAARPGARVLRARSRSGGPRHFLDPSPSYLSPVPPAGRLGGPLGRELRDVPAH
jgi:hypothetical protein